MYFVTCNNHTTRHASIDACRYRIVYLLREGESLNDIWVADVVAGTEKSAAKEFPHLGIYAYIGKYVTVSHKYGRVFNGIVQTHENDYEYFIVHIPNAQLGFSLKDIVMVEHPSFENPVVILK